MTDFTKDELKNLIRSVEYEKDNHSWRERNVDLIIKLQYLIDNYCEHENDARFNALPVRQSVKWCKKCERFYL